MKKDKSLHKLILEAFANDTTVLLSSACTLFYPLHYIFDDILPQECQKHSQISPTYYCIYLQKITGLCQFTNTNFCNMSGMHHFILFFETRSCYGTQAGPEYAAILLLLPGQCQDLQVCTNMPSYWHFTKENHMLSSLTHEHKGLCSFCLVLKQYFQKLNSQFTFFKCQ